MREVGRLFYTVGMQKLMLLMLMGIWGVSASYAEGPAEFTEPPRRTQSGGKGLWRASVAAVTAANVLDAASSWGKRELNPNLAGNNGTFGGQGAVLKLGMIGGVLALESLVLRHQPSPKLYRRLAVINFAGASVTGATAIRNLGIPRH